MSDDVRVYKASYELQSKIGRGPLSEELVKKSQIVLDKAADDFQPIANVFLDKLDLAVQKTRSGALEGDAAIEAMTQPVMELKANARMFRYGLVSTLANIMLGFLEATHALDKDAIDIVGAHHKTLSAIVVKKMEGDGGEYGVLLERELTDAVARYMSKRS